jgi:3-hydroxy-9,10-secoandrosta-1,3,5(10)-triene-9,17-dione monooxygenase
MSRVDPPVKPIPPPESALSAEHMIARAVEMRGELRQRQMDVESNGDVSEEMNRKFVHAGFYRVVQPRIFGGYELPLPQFVRLIMEVARGCPESAWVLSLTAGHNYQLASFPVRGLVEIYDRTGEVRAPEVTAPPGEAVSVPGGYRVSGTWDYASGSTHATHLLVVAHVLDPTTQARGHAIMAIVERKDYTIVKNWNVFGMQGTGSNRVVIRDVFVPDYRTKPMYDTDGRRLVPQPDRKVLGNPLYHGPFRPFVLAESVSVVVGAARGALDCYEENFRSRKLMFPIQGYRYELPEFQFNFGRCQALIDTATAALLRVAEEYMERATVAMEGGAAFDEESERRLGMVEQQCIHLAWEAVDIIFRTAGTSSARKDSALGRYLRNIAVMRGHLAHQSDSSAMDFGRRHFGLPAVGP